MIWGLITLFVTLLFAMWLITESFEESLRISLATSTIVAGVYLSLYLIDA